MHFYNRKNICFLGLVFLFFLTVLTCSPSKEIDAEDTVEESSETVSGNIYGVYNKNSAEVMDEKDEYHSKLNKELDRVDKIIEELEDEAKELSADVKREYQKVVNALDDEREKIVNITNEVDNATDEEWDDLKSNIDSTISNMEKAINNIVADIKD